MLYPPPQYTLLEQKRRSFVMAYTDDAVKAKLSALNETQESIVTVAQWVMFHRRHADRTAAIWLQKLKEAGGSKRLNLIYLANGIVTSVTMYAGWIKSALTHNS